MDEKQGMYPDGPPPQYPGQPEGGQAPYPPQGGQMPYPAQGGQAPYPAQGGQIQQPVAQTVTIVQTVPMRFGPDPARVTCPHCRQEVVTNTSFETGLLTWIIVGTLCFLASVELVKHHHCSSE